MSALQRLVIVAVALFQVTANGFFINETYNTTENWSIIRHIQMSMPLVIKSNNILMHVLDSRHPNHPIRLESTDYATCLVSLKLRYPYRYPRRAVSLGNGKIIIWLLNYQLTPSKHLGEWRFVVVRPHDCTYRDFEIEDSDPHPIDLIGVVGYNDTFDVFFTSLIHEEPRFIYVYRYNDEGSPVSSYNVTAIQDLDSYPFYRPNTIHVHAVKDYDPSEGYFYVQSKPATHTAVIKRLSPKFTIISRTKLNYSKLHGFNFNSYSTHFGNFTVCRYYERRNSLQCSLLNTNLNEIINVVLNYATREGSRRKSLVHLVVTNTADGGAILTYGVKTSYMMNIPIYVQKLSPYGWATDSEVVGNIFCEIYDIQNFYMVEDRYCIVVTCDEEVHTRCIRVT